MTTNPEFDASIVAELTASISELRDDGCPVASHPEKTARVALRRWRSYRRRSVSGSDIEARFRDLVNGLVQQLERDPALVGPLKRDYECIAERVVPILARWEETAREQGGRQVT